MIQTGVNPFRARSGKLMNTITLLLRNPVERVYWPDYPTQCAPVEIIELFTHGAFDERFEVRTM